MSIEEVLPVLRTEGDTRASRDQWGDAQRFLQKHPDHDEIMTNTIQPSTGRTLWSPRYRLTMEDINTEDWFLL